MGVIFDISRFCLNDGPGIRTTVFLKGCPLRCIWCHNPESQRERPEILYAPERCMNCGACVPACAGKCHTSGENRVFDRQKCVGCGACAEACPSGALRLVGHLSTVREVMQEVLKDREFYEESGGGLTVSGGEPMLQIDFLEALLALAKQEGVHTCIETCGWAPEEAFRRIAPLVDCFLFDWKESDPEKHRRFTGVDNGPIRRNLECLGRLGAQIILRMLLIPGYNDTEAHIAGTAVLVNRCAGIGHIEIMPYHPLGISKARELGREDWEKQPDIPGKTLLDGVRKKLQEKVTIPVILSI